VTTELSRDQVADPAVAPRRIAFASTPVTPEARTELDAVLDSGWLTTGRQAMAFEEELADYLGVRNAVAVSSCTAALELTLRALRLPPGADVLTPTLTFCGAVHAIVHAGLHPVLVDVDAETLVPRPDQVARAAASCSPAAMVVQHMAGYPVDVQGLTAAAGLPPERVVEDAAHALGTFVGDVPVGRVSHAASFSFYATKNLPMGEGGAVTTEDDELAGRVRQSRLHGMSHDAWRRYAPGGGWRYSVEEAGLKANLSDVHAAIGRGQLRRLPEWQARRAQIADVYDEALAGIRGIVPAPRPPGGTHAWHLYIVRVTPEFGVHRDDVAASLAGRGVDTSVHFIPVHRFPYFRRLLGRDACTGLVEADAAFEQILSLPLHPGLTDDDVRHVARQLRAVPG
jgi:dTDP-4-amino-4,6-dideoxygalactose transaminase